MTPPSLTYGLPVFSLIKIIFHCAGTRYQAGLMALAFLGFAGLVKQ